MTDNSGGGRLSYTIGLDMTQAERDVTKLDDQLARLGTGKMRAAGQKDPSTQMAEQMEHLLSVSRDTLAVFDGMTKALREQIALREKELNFKREESRTGSGTGTGGVKSPGGVFGQLGALVGIGGAGSGGLAGGPLGMAMMLGNFARAAGQASERWSEVGQRGYRGTEVVGAIGETIDSIPVLGRIMGGWTSAAGSIAKAGKLEDQWRNLRHHAWVQGGEQARLGYTNQWDYDFGRERMIRYGINREESLAMELGAAKATGMGVTNQYEIQGRFGLGNEQTALMGALRRTGASVNQTAADRVFAETIGVAISTQLERGRWGEMWTVMTRAAQSVQHGEANFASIAERQRFVGQLGAGYQGDTAQARQMNEMFNQIGSGKSGGVMGVLALQAAMRKTGSYAGAKLMLDAGLDSSRGMSFDMLAETIKRHPATDLFLANKLSAVEAAHRISLGMPGTSINTILDMLNGLKSGAGGRMGASDAEILKDLYQGQMDDTNIGPTRADIKGQMPHSSKVWGMGFDQQGGANTIDDLGRPMKPGDVSAASWNVAGDDLRSAAIGGRTSAQQSAVSQYRTFRGSSASRDPFVADMAEAEMQYAARVGHGFGSKRGYDGTGAPVSAKLIHGGRDIYMPPGSPVYAPVNGVWVRGEKQTAQYNAGFYGEMRGEDNLLYRFLHLESRPRLRPGTPVAAGTLIGYSAKHKIGASRSHLHFEAWKGDYKTGERVDPFQSIGLEGVNRLYTGYSSRADYEAAQSPVTTPDGGTPAAPASAAPGAATQPQAMNVNITVHDARVSVTKAAGRTRTGAIGQNFSTRGR